MSQNQMVIISGKEVVLSEMRALFNDKYQIKKTPYGLDKLREDIRSLKALAALGVALGRVNIDIEVDSTCASHNFHDLLKAVLVDLDAAGKDPFDGPHTRIGFEYITYNREVVALAMVETIWDLWAAQKKAGVMTAAKKELEE